MSPVRFVRGATFLLFLGGFLVVALPIGWGAWVEIQSGTGSAEQLMQDQAQSIADLVRESGIHGFGTYQRWEDEVAERLFDNARWVAQREAVQRWNDPELARLADAHRLGRINIFDASGRKIASSRLEPEESLVPKHDPRDFIQPVLDGRVRELRIGFKEARFRGGHRFAVAVARPGGGAVVVNVFADSMRTILDSVRPGHLVGALGSASGLRYVVLQHGDSLVAISPDTLDAAALPLLPAGDAPLSRDVPSPLGRVYEVARTVDLPGIGPTLARIGLDAGPLQRARAALRGRALFRASMIALLAALGAGLLLLWQRKTLLAQEVRETRAELRTREVEMQRATRLAAMGELAAHVAHEIRNPLNTIHLTVQEMARDPALASGSRERAEDLRAETRRIEDIVQQFLDLARPRRPRRERLDLHHALAAAARAAEPAFRASDVALEVEAEPVSASLDPNFVAEILDNLLRNAREASPPGGRVRLSLRRSGGDAIVTVDDQGPGVPPELRERVFDLFYTTRTDGTGLGLSIVAQLTAAMGGGVRLDSAPGGGARAIVHWPLEEATP
jgi:signal transduction histidine kinase